MIFGGRAQTNKNQKQQTTTTRKKNRVDRQGQTREVLNLDKEMGSYARANLSRAQKMKRVRKRHIVSYLTLVFLPGAETVWEWHENLSLTVKTFTILQSSIREIFAHIQ